MTPLISIVVPVYNEARTVADVIQRLIAIDLPAPREILVVNDGSTDGTREVLDQIVQRPELRIIHAEKNGGKGSAIRIGFARATGTIVAIQDADLELDPAQIAELVQPILDGKTTVVYGSRFLAGRPAAPMISIVANEVLTGVTNLLFGGRLTDMETCYKVMTRDVAQSLNLESNRFDIEPEITAKLLRAGHAIYELPIRFEPRSRAQGKKIGWRDGVRAVQVLVKYKILEMTRLRQGSGVAGSFVAALVAIGLAAFGVVRGTWAVGGSDSSCYGVMAKAFAEGHLQPATMLADAPWPNASLTFAPGGFIPSPLHAGAAAPICAPGMSVLMAPLAALFGPDAIFWLTPIAAAFLVLSAFAIARQLAGGIAGATAAILVATSPIVLYQTVQPMNDIVTAALWLAAIAVARRTALTGVLIGLAILVRPNLAPLALVLAVIPFLQHGPTKGAWRSLLWMVAGSLPGVLGLLWMNHAIYGSAIGSGYGAASNLFRASNVDANIANYRRALYQTQHIVPAIALLAPFVFDGIRRRGSVLLLAFAGLEVLIYLFYQPFPEWWYLRFLIPAIAILLILASAASVHLLSKNRMGGMIPIAAVILGVVGARTAGERQAFALQRMEGRYRQSAELVRDRLPPNAVLITVWESGSMRFHAGREIVMWDSLDPAWLDRAIAWLKSKGQQPFVILERREEGDFRARFRDQSEIGKLDWPPRFDVNREVRIFDPDDRGRYLAGESYATENIRARLR